MPLSLYKLEKLLSLKGFIASKFFVMDGICMYIEVLSIINAEIFLMYIPSKYKFRVDKESSTTSYKIKYIDLDETDNIVDNYAGELDENTIENTYKEVDINMSPSIKGGDIGQQLEENYKRHITLKDILTEDFKEVRDIVRQLKRLKFCVQNVKYKIAILYKNYLCSIKRDDSIECYSIRKYDWKKSKKLFITVDLELFYEKIDSLILNMAIIRKGIYHILDKNHFTHNRTFQQLLEDKNNIINFSESTYIKKKEYEKYLKEAQEMLEAINTTEKHTLEKIYEINEQYNNINLKGLHNDIEKSHIITKYNNKLQEVQKIKEDIVKTIFELKTKRENNMLNVDKIMFDNNVMLECVMRNFSELSKLCN